MSSQATPRSGSYEEFIRERRYLLGVTERTIGWYGEAFKWLVRYCPEEVTEAGLKACIIAMRQKCSPITVNGRIRVFKAYLKWADSPIKLNYLKEEQKEVRVFKLEEVKRLLAYRPKGRNEQRVKVLFTLLIDCGLRLEESLCVRVEDLDWDNLLVKVKGKGNKERLVPISFECRKVLFLYTRDRRDYVFATGTGTRLSRRNALRDFKNLCKQAGVVPPSRALHAVRHTFSVNYLRQGGNIYYLGRVLGHNSGVRTTEIYLRAVGVDALSAVHQGLSILGRPGT